MLNKVRIGVPWTMKDQLGSFCASSDTVRFENACVVAHMLMNPEPMLAGLVSTSSESPGACMLGCHVSWTFPSSPNNRVYHFTASPLYSPLIETMAPLSASPSKLSPNCNM